VGASENDLGGSRNKEKLGARLLRKSSSRQQVPIGTTQKTSREIAKPRGDRKEGGGGGVRKSFRCHLLGVGKIKFASCEGGATDGMRKRGVRRRSNTAKTALEHGRFQGGARRGSSTGTES